MSMDLDALFAHREDWQRSAFESIKQSLISVRDNRFVRYDGAQEEHLVIIYGNSQVGKTTLILTMIGIQEGKCFREVSETLRAGISPGNSSTSTAIIYSQSEDDRYGFAVASIDNCPPQEFQSYDAAGMVQQLVEVRKAVESNRIGADSILYITIPKRCFTKQAAGEPIIILDMPGVNSRNHREDDHVQSLMTRYFPIASACIIACRCNVIQSLETLELPDGTDWKRMEHRFVLAVTHAYNDGSIKKYFAQPRKSRETGLYSHVMKVYTENIRDILGRDNHTAVYPIDVGNSLEALCRELTDEEDRRELMETRDRVLSGLRDWIAGHRDNRLKAALDNLRDVVEHAGEDAVLAADRETGEIRKGIGKAQRTIQQAEEQIQRLIGGAEENLEPEEDGGGMCQRGELLEELRALQEARKKLQAFSGVAGLYQALEKELLDKGLKKGGDGTYWNDKEKNAYAILRTAAADKAREGIKALKPEADVSSAIRPAELDQQCMALWTQKAPTPQGIFSFKKDRVYIDKLEAVCQDVEDVINHKLYQAIVSHIQRLDKEQREKEQEIRNVEHQAGENQARIRRLHREIAALEKRLLECEDRKERLKHRKRQDQKTLDMYKKYARQAHEEQRRKLMAQINSKLPSGDKLMLILFLGVLDRDYQKVTGGGYESRN